MKKQWREANGQCPGGFFKKMMGGFLGKFDKSECKQGKGEYKLRRAVIVSNPEGVLQCAPGSVCLHDIEVMNKTHWGWKKGVFLGLDSSVEQSEMPIELVNLPVDQKVEAMENLKMTVPISVLPNAKPGMFEFNLRFRGPKGGEIGEPIPIKLNVLASEKKPEPVVAEKPKEEEKMSHLEMVKLAVKLFDQEKLGQTFNECLEVV